MITTNFQGEQIPMLSMGCMRLPQYDDVYAHIDEAATREMVKAAMASGVNYFDTAYGYHDGESERMMGKILKNYPRDSFYLTSKFPAYDAKNWPKVEEIFEEQLAKCQVDYFDFYLAHNLCEMNVEAYLDEEKYGILPYLIEQKRNGRIRHLGVSSHAEMESFKRFMDAYGEHMEFVQLQVNYMDWDFQRVGEKVDLLNQMGIPVWVMEPLRGGKLASLPQECMDVLTTVRPEYDAIEWALRYLQTIPGVATVLTGASSLAQLQQNIAIFNERKPLNDSEMAALQEVAAKLTDGSLPCTACRYCTKYCPKGLDIPHLISLYNQRSLTGSGDFIAPMALSALPEDKLPAACIGCRKCEAACPQNIGIAHAMSSFAALMKE